jgi:hypothetical protein
LKALKEQLLQKSSENATLTASAEREVPLFQLSPETSKKLENPVESSGGNAGE